MNVSFTKTSKKGAEFERDYGRFANESMKMFGANLKETNYHATKFSNVSTDIRFLGDSLLDIVSNHLREKDVYNEFLQKINKIEKLGVKNIELCFLIELEPFDTIIINKDRVVLKTPEFAYLALLSPKIDSLFTHNIPLVFMKQKTRSFFDQDRTLKYDILALDNFEAFHKYRETLDQKHNIQEASVQIENDFLYSHSPCGIQIKVEED